MQVFDSWTEIGSSEFYLLLSDLYPGILRVVFSFGILPILLLLVRSCDLASLTVPNKPREYRSMPVRPVCISSRS